MASKTQRGASVGKILLIAVLLAESAATAIKSKTSEFTLDELTRADQSYLPINFGSFHSAAAAGAAKTQPADGDGSVSHPNRQIQLIGEYHSHQSDRAID